MMRLSLLALLVLMGGCLVPTSQPTAPNPEPSSSPAQVTIPPKEKPRTTPAATKVVRKAETLSKMGRHEEAARTLESAKTPLSAEQKRRHRVLECFFWIKAGRLDLAHGVYQENNLGLAHEGMFGFARFIRTELSESEWQALLVSGIPMTAEDAAVMALHGLELAAKGAPEARDVVSRALASEGLEEAVRVKLEALDLQVEDSPIVETDGPSVVKLGVVLPLTGLHRRLGQRVIQGIQLAVNHAQVELELVVRDSGGEPQRAVELVQELSEDPEMGAILGPVGRDAVSAVAGVAEDNAIPLVHLAVLPDDTGLGQCIFQVRMSYATEVQALVSHAANQQNASRYAIVYPESSYGMSMHLAFVDSVESLGGDMVAAASFPEETQDFSEVVESLLEKAGEPIEGRPFDMLFVPVTVAQSKRLLPYLRGAGVVLRTHPNKKNGVQLMSTRRWSVPGVFDRAEGNTENAIFSSVFAPEQWQEETQWFVTSFQERYLTQPGGFDAEVFDASRMLIEAFQKARLHHGDRLAVCQTIQEGKGELTGVRSFTVAGKAERDVRLMTLQGEQIRLRQSEEDEVVLRDGKGDITD